MGCLLSKPTFVPPGREEPQHPEAMKFGAANSKDVLISGISSERVGSYNGDEGGFVAWSEMENAEEQDYLVEEEKGAQLDQLLEKQYSDRHRKQERSYNDPAFWLNIMNSIEPDPDTFQLTAPFTLKKAHALYRYLRSGKARPIPRKFVYEVLIASCKHLEVQSKECGALQHVPPPSNKSERLFVCGDTHGQLQANAEATPCAYVVRRSSRCSSAGCALDF